MSGAKPPDTLGLHELAEWLDSLGLPVEGEEAKEIREQLTDGVLLCQLVNKIKPGSVEIIKPRRSSGDAEENILRFLQACTTVGVKKIFKPLDLLDENREFSPVLLTLQQLYRIASSQGMGINFSKRRLQPNGTARVGGSGGSSPTEDMQLDDVEEEDEEVNRTYRAMYSFSGANDDELQFEKGDLITVTKVVDGGWWEGISNGKVGWFPGNYVEECSEGPGAGQMAEDSPDHYHNLVVQDILTSERSYVRDLHTLLSTYLVPLQSSNVVTSKDIDHLTGNLPELSRWQQGFFTSLEDCSRLPVPHQNMGTLFLKASKEMESLYSTYCANHPQAVAVLTENSDKLSAFMESRGAASPGMLTLTTNLSKPFRRLEKYSALLKELQRQLAEGHPDADSVAASIQTYTAISKRTQEIRKKKEMEHEMLSNPVQGYRGQCLNELGLCSCVIQVNQALASEVEERFFLVFRSTSVFIILAVGQSLSGYEMKANIPLATLSVKKGQHSEQWPYPVEILHQQETIHASLLSEKDQRTLIEAIGRQEGVPTRQQPQRAASFTSTRMTSVAGSRASSTSIFRMAYAPRAMRRTPAPIHRPHHWGLKSLRPLPPLMAQQLIALREHRDLRSPRTTKKFIYPAGKKKRSSKSLEEFLSTGGVSKPIVENKVGDTAILRVIEAYCISGKSGATPHLSDRGMAGAGAGAGVGDGWPIPRSLSHSASFKDQTSPTKPKRPHVFSSIIDDQTAGAAQLQGARLDKSFTLPSSGRYGAGKGKASPHQQKKLNHDIPCRPPSPLLLEQYNSEPSVAPGPGSVNRRRAGSVGAFSLKRIKNTLI